MCKIYAILGLALTHLAPGRLYNHSYAEYETRCEQGHGHTFICHALLQAEQELAGEDYDFPLPMDLNTRAIQFLCDLGMTREPWPTERQDERWQMERFTFLHFAYLVAKDMNV